MDEKYTLEKKPSLAKSTLPFGIAFGIIMIIELALSLIMDFDAVNNSGIGVSMSLFNYLVLPVIFISLACNNYKNKINGGYISFIECIKAGVSVCVVAGLLFSVASSLIYAVSPEIKTDILEKSKVALAKTPGMTSELMQQSLTMSEVFMRPYILIPITVIIYAFVGLIISLIVGAIVRKENPGAFN